MEKQTLGDLIGGKAIAACIRTSAEHVLKVALERDGLTLSPATLAELARELGNNAAMTLLMLEVE